MNIKNIFLSKSYIALYPLVGKKDICKKINTCDLTLKDDFSSAVNELYRFILAERELINSDKEQASRNKDSCYRNKKVEYVNSESGEKHKEKIKVEKKFFNIPQGDLQKYETELSDTETKLTVIDDLLDSFENKTLDESQLSLCDSILEKNKSRLAKYLYLIVLIAILVVLILSLIKTIAI